ncbi:beta-galactosidase [Capsulimonas corticalis]|uniref:Beta-galactosidase n=1 Tax=Capsulimonas corticalis TaxID=2219043 RepID=A0A402D382_9BACT|nr:beta-galactosidase GalA [Capsulimonas corticalis]BDI28557.1 beta-galactosidase [Capsulimonas corticalis]
MTHLTRRSLLKTGLVASAGLIGADRTFGLTPTMPASPDLSAGSIANETISDPVSARERLLLDFGWRFHFGNADDPTRDFRFGAPMREGTFSKAGQNWLHNPSDDSLQHSFDDSAWRIVDLPHDWAVELPYVDVPEPGVSVHAAHGGKALGRGFPETSIGWYQRTLLIPEKDKGLRIAIDFDGVFRDATVLFNGFYLGRNLSGYAPFRFDVTDYVNYGGSNVVTVRVDATLNEGWYYEGAGIYRHTWLVKTDPLHIAQWGAFVKSEIRKNDAQISIETEIQNESNEKARGRLISRILDPNGKQVAAVSKSFEIDPWENLTLETQTSIARPALWSIEEPRLYRVVSHIESGGQVVDHDDAAFGVRSIQFDANRGFFLNGKHVKIQGTCNHQDHGGVGIAVPDRIHNDRVAMLKAMGANAWRTAHNPVAPEVLDACDRQGMLVMAEVRMMASTPEGLSQLERMVRRDRNHPSIILWSLANEEYFYQGNATGARIISTMKRLTNMLDPTRPVTGAMNGGWGHGMSGVVDVQGFNYWNGGLPGEPSSNKPGSPEYTDLEKFHRQFPKQPTVGSETANGKSARGVYENDPKRGYAYGYKPNCADCKTNAEIWWTIYDDRPFLSGGFTWVGFDYRGEPSPYDHVAVSSQSGSLDLCGFPKDIYYYYQSWWGSEPVLHLFPHWNWEGREGQNIDIRCYTNLDQVELFLNGKSLGAKPVTRNAHLTWFAPYAPGAIEARGYKNGQLVLTDRRETTGAPAKLALRPSQVTIAADGEDVSSIAVEVQDAQGRVAPTAANKVSFKLTGPGKIIGVGNGDPSCREADKPDAPDTAARSAFSGLCMVFVQASKQAGPIKIDASADGLESATATIQSETVKIRPSVA